MEMNWIDLENKRNELIRKMVKLAVQITGKNSGKWTWEKANKIWDMCSDWNREHEDCEIFMCDYCSEDSEVVDGFMIEDDFFIYEE